MSEKLINKSRKKKKKGWVVLIVVLSIVLAMFLWVYFVWISGPNTWTKTIAHAPLDSESTSLVVTNMQQVESLNNIDMFVLDMVDSKGEAIEDNAQISFVYINLDDVQLADNTILEFASQIAQVIQMSNEQGCNIQHASIGLTSDDHVVVSLIVNVDQAIAYANNQIDEETYYQSMKIKIQDRDFVMDLVQNYLDRQIGKAIIDSILDALFQRGNE